MGSVDCNCTIEDRTRMLILSPLLAAGTLNRLMAGKTITCEARDTDRYGRTVGLCRADGDDLGAAMVRLGMAWAFVRFSRVRLEDRARSENLGVHAYPCQPAWRAQQRQ